jgi:hypothetical protein
VDDIRGHKDTVCVAKKTPNKIWFKVPTFTKYQNTQKESS